MWYGLTKSTFNIIATSLVTTSIIVADTAFAIRPYTPQQFRAVLRGLGYNVKVSNEPLTNPDVQKAVREYQQGYGFKLVDGIAGPQTQEHAAKIVEILQSNLNLVLKLDPPLPRNQYFGVRTEAAIKQYQKKLQLEETGIADLALRQKLDQEARELLDKEPEQPTPTSTPTPKPTPTPTSTPTPKPTPTPTSTPTPKPTPTPTSTPTPKPTPTSTPTETP
ncbi:peptidoglycan-binding domain-containing protein [Calothrix sp. NIES-3974]|uniref:peptidoglycan-binding domain-containing protein n=1 Tax=Calothrix sp. NIES-3974 TaxID=2005462 RepID=UPI000B5EAA3A|nr:peptidoglycan-binding protein [Calothrix sp. NIES-3974]BAZ05211.1 peptidoglycan-binding domain 1 [Calothrix sp. NIES-3974]